VPRTVRPLQLSERVLNGRKSDVATGSNVMSRLKVAAIALISVVTLIVVCQNTQQVETKLLFLTLTLPNAALLFGTLVTGFAIGVLAAGHIISNANGVRRNDKAHRETEVAHGNALH
jgi:uncharacterized integral membrane protein